MSSSGEGVQSTESQSWKKSWNVTGDSTARDVIRLATPDQPPRIPGCIWRHGKTRGYYWTIKSTLVPEHLRGRGASSKIPLAALGGRRGASRDKQIALRCQRRLWLAWHGDNPPSLARQPTDWLLQFRDYNRLNASNEHADYNCKIVRQLLHASGVADCRRVEDRHGPSRPTGTACTSSTGSSCVASNSTPTRWT
jgi:hypothetical protein